MATATISNNGVAVLVDQLGRVKARIADLEAEEARIRQEIVDSGVQVAEGRLFRCTVSAVATDRIDYKGVVEALPHTPQLQRLVRKHTEELNYTTVKVFSR